MKKTILAVLVLAIAIGGQLRAADPLDAAKQLYLAASYEEALASLGTLTADADQDAADKLRALCLLALNRRDEAGKALERLALRRPLLQFDESESPKFVVLFREARLRVLPPATKAMYVAAKASFDKGEFQTAKKQFSDLLSVLSEPELGKQPESADLKMLAEGFAKLVDQQVERQAAVVPPPAATPAVASNAAPARPAGSTAQPAAPRSPASATPPATAAGRATGQAPVSAGAPRAIAPADQTVYTAGDTGVVAPVAVDQRLPPWMPPDGQSNQAFTGLIEVVIDETGKVVSATISKSVNAAYDRQLLAAAKRWQYRPALMNGRPVKFRRVVSVVLSPTGK